ncbi:MAG: DUF7009 family protein [Bacteroidota bacterium]
MKIRIQSNDLRLRLSDDDLNQMAKHEEVSVELLFPSGKTLKCNLKIDKSLKVSLTGSTIEISITEEQFDPVKSKNRNGFNHSIALNGSVLNLSVEYDIPIRKH